MSRARVLVVIDMQNGFLSSKSRPVLPNVVDLVTRWQAARLPVLFTRFVNPPGSPFERLIGWNRMRDEVETAIVEDLREAADRSVATLDKPSYTVFTETGAALIADRGWTDLVLCGIATESCVLKSACDAFERGLTLWIVTDACSSHAGQEAHAAGLLVASRFVGRKQLVRMDDLLATV